MEEPPILTSAYKHGVGQEDILHAYRQPMRFFEAPDDVVMLIGPAWDGTPLEIGVIESSDDGPVIIHAMPARSKYLRR